MYTGNDINFWVIILIIGLATIDPHCHKVQTKLYKIPKFGVNRPNTKHDSAI